MKNILLIALTGILTISAHGAEHSKTILTKGNAAAPLAYLYTPTEEGIQIVNGKGRFNRPLYTSVDRPHRIVALTGDRPDFMLLELQGKGSLFKLANFKVGLAGGPWLSEIEQVTASYDRGVQRYQVGEGDTRVLLEVTRAQGFDGLLLRMRRATAAVNAPVVFAMGARIPGINNEFSADPNAPAGSVSAKARLSPEHCEGTHLGFSANVLTLTGEGEKARVPIHATSSVPLNFKAGDPAKVAAGPDALLTSAADSAAVGVLTAAWPASGELFFILTPDEPGSAAVKAFLADPATVFAQAVADNRAIAHTIQIDTPDPYLNAVLPAVLLGYDATWNNPAFCHGAFTWHTEYAGWRNTYGGTVAGWHERVQTHMHAFFARQQADGRIPSTLPRDEIYNMGEVLVDQALYDWEWTGDLEPLREGGFDAIALHLDWGEQRMKTPDGLYENFLNAWNTDYKWCNGGGGTIASSYYWRANQAMADIARRLGRDPSVFQQRATEIAAAMKERLWSEEVGVYGEYRDRFGHQLLHESPDLSSIYTPIYLGFTDPFESYRMLRFALRSFGTIDGLPRGGKLIYSSEILPNHYSTRGLYSQEIIDTLVAMYRLGQSEAAEPFRRAIDGSFFSGPGPGSTSLSLLPDGRYNPNSAIDFTDPTSLYLRNVVEGMFGIQMDGPNKRIVLQPSFPLDWEHASIVSPAVAYQYTWDGTSETLSLKTPRALEQTVRLRARYASIEKVAINGKRVNYTVEPGIDCAWIVIKAPLSQATRVEVSYAAEPLPVVVSPSVGLPGETVVVKVDRGRMVGMHDSSARLGDAQVSADAKQFSVKLPEESGVYTFFLQVAHGDARLWAPVEVDVQAPVEKAPALAVELSPVAVDLDRFRNQRLADLHKNTYSPRIEEFPWVVRGFGIREGTRTLKANGRSWWEGHGGDATASVNTALLTAAKGRFVADNGTPFAIPANGNDAVFTSLYDNFPDQIEIPVRMRGRKIHFLLAASISTAQSRMENARITVVLGDGTRQSLSLRDPENIDDWIGSATGRPYLLGGGAQPVGNRAHAVLREIDLGAEKDIQSVILETRTNETMVGLLGLTVLQEN